MDEAEFEQIANVAQEEVAHWFVDYLAVCKESGRTPSASDFAHYIPYARGFQEGTSLQLQLSEGYIVALTDHADQATLTQVACEYCSAEIDMPCVGPFGRSLDTAFFHVARYRAADLAEESADESR
jgi:hypothetical protein